MTELALIDMIEIRSEELDRMELFADETMVDNYYEKIEMLHKEIMDMTNELLRMQEERKYENRGI